MRIRCSNSAVKLFCVLSVALTCFGVIAQESEDIAAIEISFTVIPRQGDVGESQLDFEMPVFGAEMGEYALLITTSYGLTLYDYSEMIDLPKELRSFHTFGMDAVLFKELRDRWGIGAMFSPPLCHHQF